MSVQQLSYQVSARVIEAGVAQATIDGKTGVVTFDSSAGQRPDLPGPADLLVTAFAACVLKNVERMSTLQGYTYQGASIEVTAEREVNPPRISRIQYRLTVETDEPDRKMQLLHRNIARQGTIFNTLARSCEVTGDLDVVAPQTVNR
jgi:uncharacterized OsmC-like protein